MWAGVWLSIGSMRHAANLGCNWSTDRDSESVNYHVEQPGDYGGTRTRAVVDP
jgi:hypothetical protein